ncbi:MAG: permease [Verrucomicrobia bacterium]|nr:permease [Verrucomicrobiota bacterium]MDA1202780.1 permease [Verrucomicrobiota bacterium]
MDHWFWFSSSDFAYAFLSIVLEGVPFILAGVVLSGLIDVFLPPRLLARLLPRNAASGILLGGCLGAILPMCECGIVVVIRRLLQKGLPLSSAMAYLLAAPVVNPIVAISTYAAFRGQGPLEMMLCRMALSFVIAVVVASVVHFLQRAWVLRADLAMAPVVHDHHDERSGEDKVAAAVRASTGDFLDVTVFFVLGATVATLFNTSVNQQLIMPLAEDRAASVGSMMALAAVLSLCSTSDAFVAATFTAFPSAAKLAFLSFGPVVDLKLVFIYALVFRKRFIVFLIAGLVVLVFGLCAFLPIPDFR